MRSLDWPELLDIGYWTTSKINKDLASDAEFLQKTKHIILDYIQGETIDNTKKSLLDDLCKVYHRNARSIISSVSLLDKKISALDQDIYALLKSCNIDLAKNLYTTSNSDRQNHQISCALDKDRKYIQINFTIIKKDKYREKSIKITNNYPGKSLEEIIEQDFLKIIRAANSNGYKLDYTKNEYLTLINKSHNLYHLLQELAVSNILDMDFFLNQINSVQYNNNSSMCWILIIIMSIALIILQPQLFYLTLDFLNNIRNISIIILSWQSFLQSVLFYRISFQGVQIDHYRIAHFLFQTMQIALKITAYALTIAATAVITYPAASLLILSTFFDLIQCIYYPTICYLFPKQNEIPTNAWVKESFKYHEQYNDLTQKKLFTPIFGLNLSASIAVLIIVAINCSFPPSIALTLGCFCAILLISYIKEYLIEQVKVSTANRRQQQISSIQEQYLYAKPQKSLSIKKISDTIEHNIEEPNQIKPC